MCIVEVRAGSDLRQHRSVSWLRQYRGMMRDLRRHAKRIVVESLADHSSGTEASPEGEREQRGELVGNAAAVVSGEIFRGPINISDMWITEMFSSS